MVGNLFVATVVYFYSLLLIHLFHCFVVIKVSEAECSQFFKIDATKIVCIVSDLTSYQYSACMQNAKCIREWQVPAL